MSFKVQRSEAENFAQIYTKNGLSVLLPDIAIDFATDFSNIVLRNFIDICQQQVVEHKKQILMEGVK